MRPRLEQPNSLAGAIWWNPGPVQPGACCRFISLMLLFLALSAVPCLAENLYIHAGARGANNGLDWNNAWTGSDAVVWGDGPGKLGPGDTLWIAGGVYGGLTMGGSGSEEARIQIKRARAKDPECSSAPGWRASFDSIVVIQNSIKFYKRHGNYVTIDGQVEKGIKIIFSEGDSGINYSGGGVNYVELKYLELAGPSGTDGYSFQKSATAIYAVGWTGKVYEQSQSLIISHCDIHGADQLLFFSNVQNPVIEYCNLYDSCRKQPSPVHPNVMYSAGSNNGIFRYNDVWNMEGEGLFFTYDGQTGWKIYGNIFRDRFPGSLGRGIEYAKGFAHGSNYIHNNVFSNLWLGVRLDGKVAGGSVYNNIFWNVDANSFGGVDHDYNLYNKGQNNELHGLSGGPDPFLNIERKDFRISHSSSARDRGVKLSSEYRLDKEGKLRGADGKWDIGAFEFSGPMAPSNLRIEN